MEEIFRINAYARRRTHRAKDNAEPVEASVG